MADWRKQRLPAAESVGWADGGGPTIGRGPGRSRWASLRRPNLRGLRTSQSFLVPKDEIAGNDYDLSINRYKEVEYAAVEHDPPQEILARLARLDAEIAEGRKELEEML